MSVLTLEGMVVIMTDIPLKDLGYADLNVIIAGIHDCPPSHSYGPAVRDYYLIHYITEGKGRFVCRGQEYELGENQGFLICPDEVIYYESDGAEPWDYIWIGFRGLRALELLEQVCLGINQPIFYSEECRDVFSSIVKSLNIDSGRELYLLSVLYSFFSLMTKKVVSSPKSYALKAAGYITANIAMELKIGNISKMLGLDRRYFCHVFKQEYNISPQQYIINERMKIAESMLKTTKLSIADISRSIGYPDQLGFSKIFKQYFGLSPSKYRNFNSLHK